MAARFLAAALFALVSSGAADGVADPGTAIPTLSAAAARGQVLAERQCGSCHALGAAGESRQGLAPPFRVLAVRYNALSLRARLAEVAGGERHGEMPPLRLDRTEIDELTAFIVGVEVR